MIGIDPGKVTGIVVVEVAEDGSVEVLEAHQLPVTETMLWVRRELANEPPDLVGLESFIITARTAKLSRQPDALELIGVVKACILFALTDNGVEIPLSMHSPSDAKTVWSDERLKKHDLYMLAAGHAKDALRHALLATERTGRSIA